ncbi:MAG TPA: hypothetical protein VGO80_11705 [Solirubrobacteraceae bacterium]|nr:hypothetical protein [Solirubrobacteraceae bacterium]
MSLLATQRGGRDHGELVGAVDDEPALAVGEVAQFALIAGFGVADEDVGVQALVVELAEERQDADQAFVVATRRS